MSSRTFSLKSGTFRNVNFSQVSNINQVIIKNNIMYFNFIPLFFCSPELSSNEAFLNSYGSFIERAPLGQVVNIVENQDGLDKNSRNNAGGNQPQITGTNDNSVQVMSFFYKIQNYEAIFIFFFFFIFRS